MVSIGGKGGINRRIKIFNHNQLLQNNKHKFVAQNISIILDITSTERCKSQQNVLTTEIYLELAIKST